MNIQPERVLDEIAALVDGQISAGEQLTNEANDLYCLCGQAWHGLPLDDCPGTPAAGVWPLHLEFQGPQSVRPYQRHPALFLADVAEEIAEWLAESSRELDYCAINDFALETSTELTDDQRLTIHRLVEQRLTRGLTVRVPGDGTDDGVSSLRPPAAEAVATAILAIPLTFGIHSPVKLGDDDESG